MNKLSKITEDFCWFIDGRSLWFRVKILQREPTWIIQSVTGKDHENLADWTFHDGLEFGKYSAVTERLRPIATEPIRRRL